MRNMWCIVGIAVVMMVSPLVNAQTNELEQGPFTGPAAVTEMSRATETYGDDSNSWSGADRMRGNIFGVTTPQDLTLIEQYLDVPSDTTLHFSVYRKTNDGSVTGLYTRDLALDVPVTAAGPAFYSSGMTNYVLDTAYYYYICAGWDAGITIAYYRGGQAVPLTTGFGTLETGVAGGGDGNPDTYDNTWEGFSPYYQRLTFTEVPVELEIFTVE